MNYDKQRKQHAEHEEAILKILISSKEKWKQANNDRENLLPRFTAIQQLIAKHVFDYVAQELAKGEGERELLTRQKYVAMLEKDSLTKLHRNSEEFLFNKINSMSTKAENFSYHLEQMNEIRASVQSLKQMDEIAKQAACGTITAEVAKSKIIELPGLKDSPIVKELREGTKTPCETKDKPISRLKIVNASTIKAKKIEWLWTNYIPLGMVSIVAGEPGLGKSYLTCDLAAHVSRGEAMPFDHAQLSEGIVLIFNAEDSGEYVMSARLQAAKAKMENIGIVESVETVNEEIGGINTRYVSLADTQQIEDAIIETPNVKLIIIDPVTAFLSGKDSNSNTQVRDMLNPIKMLAEKYNVAIVLVTHLSKARKGVSGLNAITGSIAFSGLPRIAHLLTKESDTKRRLSCAKQNLNLKPHEMENRIFELNEADALIWSKAETNIDATTALENQDEHRQSKVDEVVEALSELLSDGAKHKEKDVQKTMTNSGHSFATYRRAKERLKVKSEGVGFGSDKVWFISLPQSKENDEGGEVSEETKREFDKVLNLN